MSTLNRRIFVWLALGLVAAAALAWSFRPQAVPVEVASVTRGPLRVEVTDEGRTRVREIFQVSAPVAGRLLRVEQHAGDAVVGGTTIVADLLPTAPNFLDIRTRTQAETAVKSAEAARELAVATVAKAKSELEFATSDFRRAKNLSGSGIISRADFERAELAYNAATAQLATAKAGLQAKDFDLQTAKALLIDPSDAAAGPRQRASIALRAPVSGRILRVLHESEATVGAGVPILEIGDPKNLEVVVQLISEDAVKVRQGARAIISDWGGVGTLAARVRRIEPSGFTKVSALGVEEQRVNVLLDFTDPPEKWAAIADGFRVIAHIVVWEKASVLRVPASGMFRNGAGWAVFAIRDGRAILTPITVGRTSDEFAELIHGLRPGEAIVIHPSDRVRDGVRVTY